MTLAFCNTSPYLRSVLVRPGVPSDIPWLLTQLRAFAAAYPVAITLYGDDAYAEGLVGTVMREQFLAVAEDESGQSVGFIAGAYGTHPYNPDLRICSELWWWVVPESRGTRAGVLLLRELEHWADGLNAPLCLTVETDSPVSDRFLAKHGFVPAERQFIRMPGGIA